MKNVLRDLRRLCQAVFDRSFGQTGVTECSRCNFQQKERERERETERERGGASFASSALEPRILMRPLELEPSSNHIGCVRTDTIGYNASGTPSSRAPAIARAVSGWSPVTMTT